MRQRSPRSIFSKFRPNSGGVRDSVGTVGKLSYYQSTVLLTPKKEKRGLANPKDPRNEPFCSCGRERENGYILCMRCRYLDLKKRGVCRCCFGNAVKGEAYCRSCKTSYAEKARERKRARRAAGKCGDCGDADSVSYRCETCANVKNIQRRTR